MPMKKILIAVDLSAMAADVIRYGCRLATALGASVTVSHAVPNVATWKGYEPSLPAGLEEEMEKTAHAKLKSYVAHAEASEPGVTACVKETTIFLGNPTELVCALADEGNFDLIVVGFRGHSIIERLLVGSTASNIIRYANTSVLLYRPEKEQSK